MGDNERQMITESIVSLNAELENVETGSPEQERLVKAIEAMTKLLELDFQNQQNAYDMDERRRLDEEFKREQLKTERRKLWTDVLKALLPPCITGGFSLFGAAMLIRIKSAIERDGLYLGGDVFKWAYNYILKLK